MYPTWVLHKVILIHSCKTGEKNKNLNCIPLSGQTRPTWWAFIVFPGIKSPPLNTLTRRSGWVGAEPAALLYIHWTHSLCSRLGYRLLVCWQDQESPELQQGSWERVTGLIWSQISCSEWLISILSLFTVGSLGPRPSSLPMSLMSSEKDGSEMGTEVNKKVRSKCIPHWDIGDSKSNTRSQGE